MTKMSNRPKPLYWSKNAYECGYQHGMVAFSQTGHTNVSPSMTEKQDFGYAWKDFMNGWHKAQKDWWK